MSNTNRKKLALFPLQLVVFPGESLNLHIFEPRYQQLIQDCHSSGMTFGIPAFYDNEIKGYGTEVELIDIVKKYPSGEADISTRGLGLFKLDEYWPKMDDKLYPGGLIKPVVTNLEEDPLLNQHIIAKVQELFSLLRVKKKFSTNPVLFKTYDIAHYIGFNLDEEYEFLTIRSSVARQQYILNHLLHILPVVKATEQLKEKAQLNGHFKHLKPPLI